MLINSLVAATMINMPQLTWGGRDLHFFLLPSMKAIYVPVLTYIGGSVLIDFERGSALPELSFPSLSFVGDDFVLSRMAILTSMSLDALEHIGGSMNMGRLPSLTLISLSKLTWVGRDIKLHIMATIPIVRLPMLTLVLRQLEIASCQFITFLDLTGQLAQASWK